MEPGSPPRRDRSPSRRILRPGKLAVLVVFVLAASAATTGANGDEPGLDVSGWAVGLVWVGAAEESLHVVSPRDTLRLAVVLEGADALAGFRVRVHVESEPGAEAADRLWRLTAHGPCGAPGYTAEIGAPSLGPSPWKRALLLHEVTRDAAGRAHLAAAAAFDLAAVLPRGARRPLCTLILTPPPVAGEGPCPGWVGEARFHVEHATVLLRDGSEVPVPGLGGSVRLRVR